MIRQKDTNRAELVKAIIKQNQGRFFTVVAKRKNPKVYYISDDVIPTEKLTEAQYKKAPDDVKAFYYRVEENFMTMTCRTGVAKGLKGGKSAISHKPELVSVYLTNGKGYRCFSAYQVLEIKAGGTTIAFNEKDVLSFCEE